MSVYHGKETRIISQEACPKLAKQNKNYERVIFDVREKRNVFIRDDIVTHASPPPVSSLNLRSRSASLRMELPQLHLFRLRLHHKGNQLVLLPLLLGYLRKGGQGEDETER